MNTPKQPPLVKGIPRKLEWGEIIPGFDDTAGGEKITSSSMAMGSHAGTAKVEKNDKTHNINVIHNFGASITLTGPNRSFHLTLSRVIDYAIENGLLDDKIDFEPDLAARTGKANP